MSARIFVLGVMLVWLLPGALVAYTADDPDRLHLLFFAPIFPFLGTCPFPVDAAKGLGLGDLYYWPILPCIVVTAVGVFAFAKRNRGAALIFTGVVALSLALTYVRFFAFAAK